eukprot:TRINITY_DN106468_c0_g1_i1.p1 TRINITY_DN106468_c0_g1~~TRINITY_DN106468_c0_g1_i1.p1  ORF type:complete len:1110 (+),score=220.45 TRINITY_DN106468_c0_g1_i1:67-3396(+)
MPLHGLPKEVAAGAVVVTSALSVLLSTAGLALLRGTRPSEVERFQRYSEGGSAAQQWLLWNVLGVFGSLLLYIGLILSSIPTLMGVSTDDEGKAAGLLQQSLVVACWLAERYLITGYPLPLLQSCTCALIWFGCTVVEWAMPRPYDNMSLGLPGQIAGCDGGYRSPFLIYSSLWLTGLTFGTLLLFCEERKGLPEQSDDEASLRAGSENSQASSGVSHAFRRKALPIVYGMATSMSGIVFATGSASNDMFYVTAGSLLLIVGVGCAWDWLWRLELPLSSWGVAFQGFSTALRVIQGHFVFRDFRWDPNDVHGILVVYKFPGLQIFMLGMFILFVSLQLYLYTSAWSAWGDDDEAFDEALLQTASRENTRGDDLDDVPGSGTGLCRGSRLWQWLLLPVCMICIFIGTHIPLIQTEFTLPELKWLHDAAAIERYEASHEPGIGHRFTDGDSYIDVINWLYDRRLPCSALVVSYNAMILPPLQFMLFFFLLLKPSFVPDELIYAMQTYVMNLAPMRFTQPCIMMLIVGIANMPGPGDTLFGGWFTHGYWYFMAYCVTAIILAWSVQPSDQDPSGYVAPDPERSLCEAACVGNGDGAKVLNGHSNGYHSGQDTSRELMRKYKGSFVGSPGVDGDGDSEEGSEDSEEDAKKPLQALGGVAVVAFIAVAMYLALTQPFLYFEYRLSGVSVHGINPSILDLWFSIGTVSRFLMCFSAATLIVVPAIWVVLFAMRMVPEIRHSSAGGVAVRLEPVVRPWVMCHIWAASFCLVYYIVTARNKAVVEVCAKIPERPVGLVAVVCMGMGVFAVLTYAKSVTRPAYLPKHGSMPVLPGGALVWGLGPLVTMAFWAVMLFRHGPVQPATITGVEDVNSAISEMLPAANRRLHEEISSSAGDCQAFWTYRAKKGEVLVSSALSEVHRTCTGNAPLAHMGSTAGGVATDITVLWATGLNSLELADVVVKPPMNMSQEPQQWSATVSGMFTDLHVFIKVLVDDEEWLSNYMCCDKTVHFTLQVSAECTSERGFGSMHLEMVHMDKIDFVQKTHTVVSPGAFASLEMDLGTSKVVDQALENFLTLKTGKLLMRNSDGSTTDTLVSVSEAISHIIELNTGHRCLLNS